MTVLRRSIFVIPCSAIEELPKLMEHESAADFLASWTSQWDPRILATMGVLPEWKRADGNSLDVENSLVLIPEASSQEVDQPQRERLAMASCIVFESKKKPRQELVADLLRLVDAQIDSVAPLHLEDFYALGYGVLQIQILARKLHYSWSIDWIAFSEQVLSACRAAIEQNSEETERWLQASFDTLSQERDRYCSQQAYLLDVALLAETTVGKSLNDQLDGGLPLNFLGSASLFRKIQESNSTAWHRLKAKLEEQTASIVGGYEKEPASYYYSARACLRQLRQGIRAYAELGIAPPKVFSRFRSGFTHQLPTWLTHFRYQGVLLQAWSEGTVPEKDQAKIRWQACADGEPIDTIMGFVHDADNASSFIDLASHLAKQLDYHHVPTLILAHWPSRPIQAFDDLRRFVNRSPSLGSFHTVESYFTSTSQPYSSDNYPSTSFKIPIPTNSEQQNSLHCSIQSYEANRVALERATSMTLLTQQLRGASISAADHDQVNQLLQSFDEECRTLDQWFELEPSMQRIDSSWNKTFEEVVCRSLGGKPVGSTERSKDSSPNWLIVNPSCHSRRVFLEGLPTMVDAVTSSRIFATESIGNSHRVVADVPPFGFVRLKSTLKPGASNPTNVQKLSIWQKMAGVREGVAAGDGTLANEFMEVQIDPKKGHLRSVFTANKRGSRMSGMTSIVRGKPDANRKWNDDDCLPMTDVRLRVLQSTSLFGQIESVGKVFVDNKPVSVTTIYSLWKGARWIDIRVEATGINSEECFCVWRTAWLNEGSSVAAWQQGRKGKLPNPLHGTVELIEVEDSEHRIYLAARGLSLHRRSGARFLISQLTSTSRGTATADFALGMDWPRPYETALDFLCPPLVIEESSLGKAGADSESNSTAWLAQCSIPNVHFFFDDVAPTVPAEMMQAEDRERLAGHAADACFWYQETQGKSGSAKFSFFRDVEKAWRVDSQGREFDTLTVKDGQISVFVKSNEQARILLQWKNA